MSVVRILALFAVAVIGADVTSAAEPRRPYRLIYNSDADNMFLYAPPPIKPDAVHFYVDQIQAAGATTIFACPNYGMPLNFPTKTGEFFGSRVTPEQAAQLQAAAAEKSGSIERATVNLQALVDQGHDPLGIILQRAKERGLEVFITFRPNEIHCVDTPDEFPLNLLLSKFWIDHPEWRVGRLGDELPQVYKDIMGPRTSPIVGTWFPAALNFAVPEVRAHVLAQLRECCERYPQIDGLDLDFQRFPIYFKPGEEAAHVATLTTWMHDVRAMTREIGERRARPILLSARIMAKPEQNLAIGLDPANWAKSGIVDFVVVSHYLRNDFPLPIAEYRRLLPETTPLYASIEVEPKADTFRDIARTLWRNGADGIMLFNYFTTRENGIEPDFALIRELGDRDAALAAPVENKTKNP